MNYFALSFDYVYLLMCPPTQPVAKGACTTALQLLGLLSLKAASEAALAEVELDGALLGGGALGEDGGAAERAGQGGVVEANDADIVGAADGTLARHALGHLDSDREVHDLGGREPAEAEAGDVGLDRGLLEGADVLAARGRIDSCRQRSGTVLVHLVECHHDGAVIRRRGQAARRGHAGRGLDARLEGSLGRLDAAVTGTDGKLGVAGAVVFVELASALDGRRVAACAVHEHGHHLGGVDGSALLRPPKSRGTLGAELALANDGSIRLRAAARGRAITRSAVNGGESGELHAVGPWCINYC